MKLYFGCWLWHYRLPINYPIGKAPFNTPLFGEIELPVPSGNRREDEGMARYHLRKKLKIAKLPKGTTVYLNSDV